MATSAVRPQTVHTAAVASAILCGVFALVAFVFGSPLEFGIALALCGMWWIVADFLDWSAGAEHRERVTYTYAPRSTLAWESTSAQHANVDLETEHYVLLAA